MEIKHVKDLVEEYVQHTNEINKVKLCDHRKLSYLIEQIESEGDEKAYFKLKNHCNIIDGNLFPSIMNCFLEDIYVDESCLSNDSEIKGSIDEDLINDLKNIIKKSRSVALGFYKDDNGITRLNINKCIKYFSEIIDFKIIRNEFKAYNRKEGIFYDATDDLIGRIVKFVMEDVEPYSWNSRYEKEIIIGLNRCASEICNYDKHENLIALNNGVYDLQNKEFLPHSNSYLFTEKSPVNYNPNEDCPVFKKALEEITCNDKELLLCMQEIFGYTLINNNKAGKIFLFTGVGSNGKSFCSDILTKIVGESNVSSIPLSKFQTEFGLEGLIGKNLNIANENEVDGYLSTQNIKSLATGDTINISLKYKKAIDYKTTVKLIFLLNNLPNVKDITHGFYRRLMIIPFNRVFKKEEMDLELTKKVCKELSGVLNWSIEGATRLIKNNYKFTESKSVNEILDSYIRNQNPVATFLKEVLIRDSNHRESRKDVLEAYKYWLNQEDILANGSDSSQSFWNLLDKNIKSELGIDMETRKIQGTRYLNGFKIDKSKFYSIDNKLKFVTSKS